MTYPPIVQELISAVEAFAKDGKRACMTCGERKSEPEFYNNDAYRDGYSTRCRTCNRAYQKDRRQKVKRVRK